MVPEWHQLKPRVRPRAISLTVSLRRGDRKCERRIVDLYRVAFAPMLPIGSARAASIVRGSESGRAKLDEAKVAEARRLKRTGWTYPELAARYGVGKVALFYAITGRTWSHVPMEPETPARR